MNRGGGVCPDRRIVQRWAYLVKCKTGQWNVWQEHLKYFLKMLEFLNF